MNGRYINSDPEHMGSSSLLLPEDERPLSLSDQIAVQIARDILNGKLEAGSKLSEYQLADRFGVSRGPVREAVAMLERNCLVRSSPRLSARVNAVTRSEVEQLFAVRREVLGMIAGFAARHISKEQTAEFRAAIEALEQQFEAEPNDIVGYYICSNRCWAVVARASKARTLNHINSMITSSPIWQIAVRERLGDESVKASGIELLDHWKGLFEATTRRDEEKSAGLARAITVSTWNRIRDTFDDGP